MLTVFSSISAQVPPVLQCEIAKDCNGRLYYGMNCTAGRCTAEGLGRTCTSTFPCPSLQTCESGKCVFGIEGKSCIPGRRNCFLGYACDLSTNKCIKGVAGTSCADEDECQKGNICFRGPHGYRGSLPDRGVCKPGVAGATGCQSIRECVDPLECTPLSPINQCLPIPQYAKSAYPQGFGKCTNYQQCLDGGMRCHEGRCQPRELYNPCASNSTSSCGAFSSCINGRCDYNVEGTTCTRINGPYACLPGLACRPSLVQTSNNASGTCVKGVVGSPCVGFSDCQDGLVCGTGGKCAKSAEGQPCIADFSCPAGSACLKNSKICSLNTKAISSEGTISSNTRAFPCKNSIDCHPSLKCLNGLCLPWNLGEDCTLFSQCRYGSTCLKGKCVLGELRAKCTTPLNCYLGFSCSKVCYNQSCAPGVCMPGLAGNRCFIPTNCMPGYACQTNCVPGKRGVGCTFDVQCQGDLRCVNSMCSEQEAESTTPSAEPSLDGLDSSSVQKFAGSPSPEVSFGFASIRDPYHAKESALL